MLINAISNINCSLTVCCIKECDDDDDDSTVVGTGRRAESIPCWIISAARNHRIGRIVWALVWCRHELFRAVTISV